MARELEIGAATVVAGAGSEVKSAPALPLTGGWEQVRTEHLIFLFGATSYAARAIDQIVERAEAAYQCGREWFGETSRPFKITVYLTSHWLDDRPRAGWVHVDGGMVATDYDAVCVFASPESPALGLEQGILEVFVRAALGAVPRQVRAPLRALASLLAAEHGIGPRAPEADQHVERSYGCGHPPPRLFDDGDYRPPAAADPAELSFLCYLQRAFGAAAFSRFARAMLTDAPPSAAVTAYGHSLEALEAAWLADVQARARAATRGSNVFRWAIPLLRPYRRQVLELLALMVVDLGLAFAIPLSSKFLLDDIVGPRDFGALPLWVSAVLVIFAAGSLASYRRTLLGGRIGELVLCDLERTAFQHVQRLSLRFHLRWSAGDLLSRLTNDIHVVRDVLGYTLPRLIFQVISLVLGTIMFLLLNWLLGLCVLLVSAPIVVFVYGRAAERLRVASRELQARTGALMIVLHENLAAHLVVKSFTLERRAMASFERALGSLFQGSMRLIGIDAALARSTQLIITAIRVLVLVVGAVLVMNGRMSLGELVAFVALIGEVVTPVSSLAEDYSEVQSASGAFDRVQEVLAQVPEVSDDPLAVDLPALEREIRVEHATFRYDGGEAALRDVTLSIPAGAHVAIVGPAGAGKSTLAGLLLRLFDPDRGRVLFDGRDIREGTLASLRQQVALVPQEPYLFDTTIAENITIGREGATDAEAVAAATTAALHPVIQSMEAGYQTPVGERGLRLSGVQRQQLALARALIRDPSVLVLDEATSALDPHTEASIIDAIRAGGRGRTTVLITDRLTAAAHCDPIFVLDHGRLVEWGTHDELCARRGLYWHLYEAQQAGADGLAPALMVQLLARVPLFSSLTPRQLALLALRTTVERYPAGKTIVRRGERADKLFVIADGQVEVLGESYHGQEQRVAVLGARSYFGEIALLGDDTARATATVQAIAPVELYSLHRDDFANLLQQEPELAAEVTRLVRLCLAQTRKIVDTADRSYRIGKPPAGSLAVPERAGPRPAPDEVMHATLILREDTGAGCAYVLDGHAVTIGRASTNDVHLRDNAVSRRHCQVSWARGGYLLEDLRSTNGTYVNGARVQTAPLRDGDLIQVGDQVLDFQVRA